jgi:Gametolysin peptidase M11
VREPPAPLCGGSLFAERYFSQSLTRSTFHSAGGQSVGSELYVAACCDTTMSSSVQMIQPPALPVGDQRTLVMIADLLDASVSCSTDNVRETLFAPPTNVFDDNGNGLSVNGEYLASSYGKVSWSGQVRRGTLNIQSTDACDLDLYSRTLDAAAAAAGIDLASYPRKLYVFPPMSQCAFIGASTTGATSSSFSFSCSTRGNYSHELGHGLGMSHAAAYYDAYTAGHGSYDNRLNQYGDYSDSMASSGWQLRGFNAPHREQMGWLPWTAEQIVNQSGQYNLAPLSMDPSTVSAPQALKIPKADGGFTTSHIAAASCSTATRLGTSRG